MALERPDERGKCRGIGGALPEVLLGKTAGQESGSPGLEVPEPHSDTEEVTGSGLEDSRWPATFPSGQGSDLAGIVIQTGPGVTSFSAGHEVIGWTDNRASQAEYVAVEEQHLTAKPAGVPWEAAGALFVAGTTAYAAARAVGLTGGDTVAVSGAAGGVGSISVQLARLAGATVIGLASEAHHPWLAGHGVIPVAYGNAMADRIRQAASKVDAFIDTFGAEYVELALELEVEPSRIDTVVNFEAVARYGVKAEGNAAASTASVLAELARQPLPRVLLLAPWPSMRWFDGHATALPLWRC